MSECCGCWGRFFGHKFNSFLLSFEPPIIDKTNDYNPLMITYADDLTKRTYIVRCVRCGCKVVEEKS